MHQRRWRWTTEQTEVMIISRERESGGVGKQDWWMRELTEGGAVEEEEERQRHIRTFPVQLLRWVRRFRFD